MSLALKVLGVIAFAVVVGAGSAWWMAQAGMRRGGIDNGSWSTNENIGAAAAGPYLRAGIAVGGLLALNKSETVYYTAHTDSEGVVLSPSCTYLVEGRDPPARWWSVTAYGADHYLIPNPQKRYAVSKTNVVRDADGRFAIRVGDEPAANNWIATGDKDEPFSLTLRLYNPEPAVIADLAHVELPRIRKVGC